jgi:hypothetical protein
MSGTKSSGAASGWRPSKTAGWQPNRVRAKSVGEFLPSLMRPAFEKYGFSSAAILTDWAALAGPELAAYTAPERLKWPRKKPGENDTAQSGATLVLRVAGARALDVEYRRPQIIERLNASFGYRAIAEIRLVQAPLAKRETIRRPPLAEMKVEALPALADIHEDRLRAAVAKLASGVQSARANCGT